MTLDQKRDAILSSLRDQFRTKVASVALKHSAITCRCSQQQQTPDAGPGEINVFLVDLANNIAQAIAEEE
jgi:hypothetical protein